MAKNHSALTQHKRNFIPPWCSGRGTLPGVYFAYGETHSAFCLLYIRLSSFDILGSLYNGNLIQRFFSLHKGNFIRRFIYSASGEQQSALTHHKGNSILWLTPNTENFYVFKHSLPPWTESTRNQSLLLLCQRGSRFHLCRVNAKGLRLSGILEKLLKFCTRKILMVLFI